MNAIILKTVFKEHHLDAIISTSQQTRLWYTGINTTAGYLFIEKTNATLLIDGRYIEMAQKNAQNVDVQLLKENVLKTFCSSKNDQYQTIGIEEEYLTLKEKSLLKNLFPKAQFVLISGQKLRIIKSEQEIAKIKKATTISLQALEQLKSHIKPGISEKELDVKLESLLRMMGADKSSFDAIIASGHRSSLPHGRASSKILEDGELVTIDFGAYFEGYAADITRTFRVGNVQNQKLLDIKEIVQEAQKRGIAIVKPGIKTSAIDKICRDYITEQGYGEYFVHSTGHGLGIDVHELPIVAKNVDQVLKPGMVITVEPGIYIPDLGGVRFEDDILVTEQGYEVLSTIT